MFSIYAAIISGWCNFLINCNIN